MKSGATEAATQVRHLGGIIVRRKSAGKMSEDWMRLIGTPSPTVCFTSSGDSYEITRTAETGDQGGLFREKERFRGQHLVTHLSELRQDVQPG
jgi:hypothetical protein